MKMRFRHILANIWHKTFVYNMLAEIMSGEKLENLNVNLGMLINIFYNQLLFSNSEIKCME